MAADKRWIVWDDPTPSHADGPGIPQLPAPVTGMTTVSRPKMIKTFSLSALFFLSLGMLFVNAAQLPIA